MGGGLDGPADAGSPGFTTPGVAVSGEWTLADVYGILEVQQTRIDAKQSRPTRDGRGRLVVIGGVVVPGDQGRSLKQEIDRACEASGLPPGQEFNWSPDRDRWMYANLVGGTRRDFFLNVLRLAADRRVEALGVIDDTRYRTAIAGAPSHEADVTSPQTETVAGTVR
jgi:hypothetical protein